MHPADVHADISINANAADRANSSHDAKQLQHIWPVHWPVTMAIIRTRTTALHDGTVNLATKRWKVNRIEKFHIIIITIFITSCRHIKYRVDIIHNIGMSLKERSCMWIRRSRKENNLRRYSTWILGVDLLHFPQLSFLVRRAIAYIAHFTVSIWHRRRRAVTDPLPFRPYRSRSFTK